MKEQQWTFVDRSKWLSGEWDGEPDKLQWTDEASGFVCMLHRSWAGHWCGYVGVPPSHPLHGVEYQNIEGYDIECHGGLTYSDHCQPDLDPVTGRGICHIPEPGEPDDLWWFGFDCGHAWDVSPGMDAFTRDLPGMGDVRAYHSALDPYSHYRNMAYARLNTQALALQLKGPTEDVCES